jgi:hypothetical protein
MKTYMTVWAFLEQHSFRSKIFRTRDAKKWNIFYARKSYKISEGLLRNAHVSYIVFSTIKNGLSNKHEDYRRINNGFPNTLVFYSSLFSV